MIIPIIKGLIQRISSEDGKRSCWKVAEVEDDGSISEGKILLTVHSSTYAYAVTSGLSTYSFFPDC